MANDESKSSSKLPVSLKAIDNTYKKPEKRNELVSSEKYEKVDDSVTDLVKLATNGVVYVPEEAFPTLFQTTKPNAAYIFENQIPEKDKRNIDGTDYAHSSSVVGLLDRKAQEVREADKQALLQYGRDSLINASDSGQAQDMRRKVDTLTQRTLPKLRKERGVQVDEVTGEPLKEKAAFHHVNPKELHTDPEDVLDPSKGRNLNLETHNDVHRNNINDEIQFEEYKKNRNKK